MIILGQFDILATDDSN